MRRLRRQRIGGGVRGGLALVAAVGYTSNVGGAQAAALAAEA